MPPSCSITTIGESDYHASRKDGDGWNNRVQKNKEIYSLSFFCTSTSQPQPHLLCRLTCSFFLSETPLFKKKNKRLLRHGRSKPNEAGLIVSSLKNGIKREHGLSATGREQAKEAG